LHLHKKLVFSKLADVYKAFNRSDHMKTSSYKSMELCSILEQNFETKINRARVKLISMMILALCKIKSINGRL